MKDTLMIKTNVISNRINNLAVNTSNRIETRYLTSSVLAVRPKATILQPE